MDLSCYRKARPGQRPHQHDGFAEATVKKQMAGAPKDPARISYETGVLNGRRHLSISGAADCNSLSLFQHDFVILPTRVLDVNPFVLVRRRGIEPRSYRL